MIFLDFCQEQRGEIANKIYTLNIHIHGTNCIQHYNYGYLNNSAGLITSYHMLDAMVAFTNTIRCVPCIVDTLV